MKRKAAIATAVAVSLLTVGTAHAGQGYRTHYYSRHHGIGPAVGLGIVGAIIGTAIIADALTGPHVRYVEPAPTAYYQAPLVQEDAYSRGYQDGLNQAREYEAGRRQAVRDTLEYRSRGSRAASSYNYDR